MSPRPSPSLRTLLALAVAALPVLQAAPALAQAEAAPRLELSAPQLPVSPALSISVPGTELSVPALSGSANPEARQDASLPLAAAPALAASAAPAVPAVPAAAAAAAAAFAAPEAKAVPQDRRNGSRPLAAISQARAAAVQASRSARSGASASASIFDSAPSAHARGIITPPYETPLLPAGVRLNRRPRPTDQGAVRTRRFHLSTAADPDGTKPVVLNADPKDPAAVERALLALVDSDPQTYGASSADMAKVHVRLVPGDKAQGQADTYYAIFRQWKTGKDVDGKPYHLMVDGGSLTFVIKVFDDGKPVVMAVEGRLYPGVSSDIMTPAYSDEELARIAERRLSSPDDGPMARMRRTASGIWRRIVRRKDAAGAARGMAKPELLTREIVNVEGRWRALNLYQAADLRGRPVVVAVDVKTGDAYAWSAQDLLREAPAETGKLSGVALARGNALSASGSDHGALTDLPLPFANVYDAQGKVVAVTDADGRFTVPGDGQAPVTLTVRLDGSYAKVADDDQKDAAVETTVTATPGQTARAVLNADGADGAGTTADVNSYLYYSQQVAWLRGAAGIDDERVVSPLGGGIRANRTDMPGNAYYDPATDSLNLEAEARITGRRRSDGRTVTLHFENTAQPSIIFHESTHRAVQILSQLAMTAEEAASRAFRFVSHIVEPVMDGGVNEAIADTVSMFMRNSPLIGEGFMIDPPPGQPNVIRTGENTTQYDPQNPDPHAQGEAYMGFTWTVRKALIEALGEAAGSAYAAVLVVPTTLFSQPKDVQTAMLHVLLGDMRRDGTIPHEDAIRKAAAAHGVDLPQSPSRPQA